ncbi:MAG: cellulase family glycosylhydrolase [Thermoleophilia bacterium]|nr:cellulase family glycosylhydrolase [Thermoleophilia bacterium]
MTFATPGVSTGGQFQYEDDATMKRLLDGLGAIGARSIRFDVPWAMVERTRGTYDWTRADRAVAAARARGLDVELVLAYSPGWANGGREDKYPPLDAYFPDYARFAAECARRYVPQGVKAFEIWNEPNLGGHFWKPAPEPERYGRLLAQAYNAVKAVAPQAVVLGMALSGAPNDATNLTPNTFAKRAYAAGAKLDALSVHPYVNSTDIAFEWEGWQFGGTGSWFGPGSSVRQTMIDRGDGQKKIWITETGDWVPSRAANSLRAQFSRWSTYSFAGPVFWYTYRDASIDPLSLTDSTWNPRPAWYAFRDWRK